jgi:T5orf172 domain
MTDITRLVYVISSPLGFQKVGWSIDPELRCRVLSTAHPAPLSVYCTWSHPQAPKIEAVTHARLSNYHAHSEWYKVTPEHAASEVVSAIMLVEFKERNPRRAPVPASTEGGKWTPERLQLLRDCWLAGESSRHIQPKLNALPGPEVPLDRIPVKAKNLCLLRPEGFQNTHNSELWTVERDEMLRKLFPMTLLPAEIAAALSALPGAKLSWARIILRARRFKLSRPTPSEWGMKRYTSAALNSV